MGYGADYANKGGFYNWQNNALEKQGVDVQYVYAANPRLPPIWEFPRAGGQSYWRAP